MARYSLSWDVNWPVYILDWLVILENSPPVPHLCLPSKVWKQARTLDSGRTHIFLRGGEILARFLWNWKCVDKVFSMRTSCSFIILQTTMTKMPTKKDFRCTFLWTRVEATKRAKERRSWLPQSFPGPEHWGSGCEMLWKLVNIIFMRTRPSAEHSAARFKALTASALLQSLLLKCHHFAATRPT